ncbi:MAG: CHY zinc finger protein [Terracidiphilus sp.]
MPRPEVRGIDVDGKTRCAHYHSALDVIAIKMACCGTYYACKECHDAVAGHAAKVWSRAEWDARAILCGVCGDELTIREYIVCGSACPRCGTHFNPGCRKHYHFYFETGEGI